ncbi:uncharacterized protein LOC110459256 isoform X1 [Mizuhopecten yessoensis]|uniref:Exoskeleton protein RP43 n=1 Tax=Mizuhopecten yessoensis TaxID=6573 RepID=A0A210Q517_MIZYE|nr:uncharacterized protein LOC110459256 isoform X1 [Mizuhopecten yessoensis]OWF43815.1 Exoskeleton protein RP43 [Mizuhopecten yessoensis]
MAGVDLPILTERLLVSVVVLISRVMCNACNTQHLVATQLETRLYSPSYGSYQNNMDCAWKISSALHDSNVQVEIEQMSLQTNNGYCVDYLQIYDGESVDSKLLGSVCRSTETFVSSSNNIYLRFYTDSSQTDIGFTLKYFQPDENDDSWKKVLTIVITVTVVAMILSCWYKRFHKRFRNHHHAVVDPDNETAGRSGVNRNRSCVWSTSSEQTQTDNEFTNSENTQQPGPVKPPAYSEIDVNPGKLPTYDETTIDEHNCECSPPPSYTDRIQTGRLIRQSSAYSYTYSVTSNSTSSLSSVSTTSIESSSSFINQSEQSSLSHLPTYESAMANHDTRVPIN